MVRSASHSEARSSRSRTGHAVAIQLWGAAAVYAVFAVRSPAIFDTIKLILRSSFPALMHALFPLALPQQLTHRADDVQSTIQSARRSEDMIEAMHCTM